MGNGRLSFVNIFLLCLMTLSAVGMGRAHPAGSMNGTEMRRTTPDTILMALPEKEIAAISRSFATRSCCACADKAGCDVLLPHDASGLALDFPADLPPAGPVLSPPPEPPRS